MRKLIAGMKVSVDGKVTGSEGYADWVEAWSDGYEVMPRIDACLLGGGMYPGYEQYWSAVQSAPDRPLPQTNKLPTPDEIEWSRFAAETPHYSGKDIYIVGGARTTASLIDAGLVDELRLIVYPLIAGKGVALFAAAERRRGLELQRIEQLKGGQISLIYGVR